MNFLLYTTGNGSLSDFFHGKRNGEAVSTYEFRKNYYFFCGDNVVNSKDCRYLGFVPEDFVIGIARRITYSENPFGTKLKSRCWKRII